VIKSNTVTLNNELCFICFVRIRFLRESIVIEFFNMNNISRYYDAIFEQRAIEYYLQNEPIRRGFISNCLRIQWKYLNFILSTRSDSKYRIIFFRRDFLKLRIVKSHKTSKELFNIYFFLCRIDKRISNKSKNMWGCS
jgi:hypothetical protein